MGCGQSTKKSEQEKDVDKQLKEDAKSYGSTVKLLLLGTTLISWRCREERWRCAIAMILAVGFSSSFESPHRRLALSAPLRPLQTIYL